MVLVGSNNPNKYHYAIDAGRLVKKCRSLLHSPFHIGIDGNEISVQRIPLMSLSIGSIARL
jgi:hypothetical protein